MAEILGTNNNEVLKGTDEDDTLIGLSGYDTLDGGEGSDTYIVNAGDFNGRFVDFYNDSGTVGTDVILAAEAGVDIGLGSGFDPASGIEVIDGVDSSRIVGDDDQQIWDFSTTSISGVSGIFGNGGRDEIIGTESADTIDGGSGSDTLFGGAGDDIISGGTDSDFIEGGDGLDTLSGDSGHDTIDGGDGNDTILGGDGHDSLNGGNGRDTLTGGAGYDTLDGGEGEDVYLVGHENAGFVDTYNDSGTDGIDKILATEDGTVIGLVNGFGPDSGIEIIAAAGNADVSIGGTNDTEIWDFSQTHLGGVKWINALGGHDVVTGNNQNNRIDAGDGNDIVDGGAGRDRLFGGDGHDILNGGDDNDRLDGGHGADTLDGGAGDDLYLFGVDSNGWIDTIIDSGTSDRDRIVATEDNVEIGLQSDFSAANGIEIITARRNDNVTLEGSDEGVNWNFSDVILRGIAEINGGASRDIIHGAKRHDVINGEAGHDQLYGGTGNDTLNGGADSDFLYGEDGRDTLFGGTGNDILNGGAGNDNLTGGEGFDIFEFSAASGTDVISDFTVSEDWIDLTSFDGEISFADLSFQTTTNGVRVDFGDSSVILENIEIDAISEDMFIF